MKFATLLPTLAALALGGCVVNNNPPTPPHPVAAAPAAPTPNAPLYHSYNVLNNSDVRLVQGTELNPDCSVAGITKYKIIQYPTHGNIQINEEKVYSTFPLGNARYACNGKPEDGISAHYKSEPGFVGHDATVIQFYFPSGTMQVMNFDIDVH
jgi:hypothetical protein